MFNQPSSVRNSRRNLLLSAGLSTDDEAKIILHLKTSLLADIFEREDTASAGMRPEGLSRTAKSDLSRWLRQEVRQRVTKGDP